jgi:tetratricopeptide (TPR) repeat protein
MSRRVLSVALAGLVGAAVAISGDGASHAASPDTATIAPGPSTLPVPPVPPRIAQGDSYERCLAMLTNDPAGANSFADAWVASGGGDGAVHCLALAQIELGNPDQGAAMLEHLAGVSKAPDLARASVYGQAVQAWMMANKASNAYDAATLALSLSPADVDLLIDRAVASATMDHYMEAVDDLDHALAIDPRRAEALVLRGSAWRHLDQLALAQDDIDRAMAIDPDNPEALLERGILRQRQGNGSGARDDWERAIALDPDSTAADLAQQNLALLDAGPKQ